MELDISLAPEILFYIFKFPVSNSFLWLFSLSLVLMIGAIILSKNLKMFPGKVQSLIEMLIGGAHDFTVSIIGEGKKADRAFPLVATMFFFVLIANLVAYIPGQAAFSLIKDNGEMVPIFRAIVADYGFVFVMTIISILTVQIVAIIASGPFSYLTKFINFRSPMKFFLGLMDLVGELAKIISLSFRLFGNIFAGEVLGAVVLFLFPFFTPLPFLFLGLLTAVVQAFVFAVLTLVFISIASDMGKQKLEA